MSRVVGPQPMEAALPALREKIEQAQLLLLFLDYDGTLAPLVDHPSQARLPAATRHLLDALVREPGVWVTLVSGRGLGDLKGMVKLRGVCFVGNHGLELQGPQLSYVNPVAEKCRPLLRRIVQKLRATLRPIAGAWVENKGLTLSVHYRSVDPGEALLVRNGFYDCLRPYSEKRQVRVTAGNKVFEVRPPVHWTKGTIVNWLVSRRRAVTGNAATTVIYIGDDQTDEDAFTALGSRGVSIVVGASNPLSQARYRLRSPRQVQGFLRWLLRTWQRKQASKG